MTNILTPTFVVFGVVALIATLASSLLSPKAVTLMGHLVGLGRLGVFSAVAYWTAQVLQTGMAPSREQVVMVISLAVIYCAQARSEILRQRRTDARAPWGRH